MQWEQLSAPEFAKAVRETGVCVIAMGVIETHAPHLPLGTDYLVGHSIACLAAEKEPAVVFPPFYFGQIYEARCFPGTVTIKPGLLLELIQDVFDEIGRNGFKKIIVYNAHGGNRHLLRFLAQCSLWEEKPYCIYMPLHDIATAEEEWEAMRETSFGGHADEYETSMVLATYPHLVRMDRVPEDPATPLNRMKHLPPTFTGVHWYSDYPDHNYAGDARAATEGKGQTLVRLVSDRLAKYTAAVKADKVVPTLNKEFFRRGGQVSKG